MGTCGILGLGLVILFQAFAFRSCEKEELCQTGFLSDSFLFKVDQTHLHKGRTLGRVLFDDCSGRQRFLFNSEDSHFEVESDGTVVLKRPVNLLEGHKSFSVHAWDSKGRKVTVRVRVQHVPKTADHSEMDIFTPDTVESTASVPVLVFPQSSTGLQRRKRDWVIPPINIFENDKGPFPRPAVKIRSSRDKEFKVLYSISGPGANEPPVGLFTMDKDSGQLYVTQPLDREKQASYKLFAHVAVVGGNQAETPIEIEVIVNDQNDNKPVFTQDAYICSVPEATSIGFELMTVTATDADDPFTYNADLKYSILSQDPNVPSPDMFAINPITGVIRLNSAGLDKEKYPQYTLTIQAADLAGEGFTATCRVIITVTDSNDQAPKCQQLSKGEEAVRKPETPTWFAKFTIVEGNDGGIFNVTTALGGLDGKMDATGTGIILTLKTKLPQSKYNVILRVYDVGSNTQDSTLIANVCDPTGGGTNPQCRQRMCHYGTSVLERP